MPLLLVDRLSVAAPRQAPVTNGVTLAVEEGAVTALVGESGSGKSVTAHAVLGLLPSPLLRASGHIYYKDRDISALAPKDMRRIRGKEIAMVFQEPMSALNPLHTVYRQIAEALLLHQGRLPPEEIRRRVERLLTEVRLERLLADAKDVYPHELSGGQRQRVMLAIALANDPSLLIADEPTTALDVTTQAAIFSLLQEMKERRRMGILLITHDLALTRRFSDRVYVMRQGEIVESGATQEVVRAPSHPYTRELLEARSVRRKESPPLPAGGEIAASAERASAGYEKKSFFKTEIRYMARDVSFSLPLGRTLGVVGGSGSGKTTLAMALLGLLPVQGRIVVGGTELAPLPDKRRHAPLRSYVHIVFQDPFSSLNPRMTVRDILSEGPRAAKNKAHTEEAYLAGLLRSVRLPEEALDRYPHEFSGGQRQRIALARALAMEPKALILDEPTSALDVTTQKQMLDLLLALQRERGMAYVLISHDMHVIGALSDDVLVLQDGEVAEYGPASEILSTPKHPYTQELIRAAA